MSATSPKILIVDDEPDLLDITAVYLEMERYTPITALNGPAALEILNSTVPDLIISDITMPGMSGFDLFGRSVPTPSFKTHPSFSFPATPTFSISWQGKNSAAMII